MRVLLHVLLIMAYVCKHPNSPYWTGIYKDETGAWRRKSTKEKERKKAITAALEWERAGELGRNKVLTESVSREIVSGILERTTGDTLRKESTRDFCARWLKGKTELKHEGTSTRYAGSIEKFLGFLGSRADMPIQTIGAADCSKYMSHLVAQNLAPATLVVEIKTLRSVLNAALRQTLIAVNPALSVELPERVKQVRRKQFTPAQVQMILDAASDAEWKTVILIGYYAGLRLSDCVMLDWQSVDFVNRKLVLDIRKTSDEGHTVPLHPVLEKHLQGLAGDKGGPVCPGLASVPVGGRSGLSKQFLAIMKKAGIGNDAADCHGQRHLSRLSFHSLRVSFNSELHNRSVSQETRKKLTGHKSDAVNDRYTRTEMKTLRNAVTKLPKLKV
jgi:integrase